MPLSSYKFIISCYSAAFPVAILLLPVRLATLPVAFLSLPVGCSPSLLNYYSLYSILPLFFLSSSTYFLLCTLYFIVPSYVLPHATSSPYSTPNRGTTKFALYSLFIIFFIFLFLSLPFGEVRRGFYVFTSIFIIHHSLIFLSLSSLSVLTTNY